MGVIYTPNLFAQSSSKKDKERYSVRGFYPFLLMSNKDRKIKNHKYRGSRIIRGV